MDVINTIQHWLKDPAVGKLIQLGIGTLMIVPNSSLTELNIENFDRRIPVRTLRERQGRTRRGVSIKP